MRALMVGILCGCLLFSCKKDNEILVNSDNKLIGYWSNPVYSDSTCKYERVGALKDEQYTLFFNENFTLVERKNVGFCGTPPITYGNFDGTWSIDKNLIKIEVGYWGGTASYEWKIISADDKYLTIYRIKEDYHWENKN